MATATVIMVTAMVMAMAMAMGDRIILLPANAREILPLVNSEREIA